MVRGLAIFRERFRSFQGLMTLIGGAACDEWFTANGMSFRATDDLDLVIMLDKVNQPFINAVRAFVKEGKYKISERGGDVPILYRFADPTSPDFPIKLEFCSRKPEEFELSDGQKYIPISNELGTHSLSAILLDDAYFELIQAHHDERDGLWVANATSLIPLKSHAWLNLTKAEAAGEAVDSLNIKKHRNDVFRLATTLPGVVGPDLPQSIKSDLVSFLQEFPSDFTDWPAILASLRNTIQGTFRPADLREAIQTYFQL